MSRSPKLTPAQADEIRDLYRTQNMWTITALARSFHVNLYTIRQVLDYQGAYRRKPSLEPSKQ